MKQYTVDEQELRAKRKAYFAPVGKKYFFVKVVITLICLGYSVSQIFAAYFSRELVGLIQDGDSGFSYTFILAPFFFILSAVLNYGLNAYTNTMANKAGIEGRAAAIAKISKTPSVTDKHETAELLQIAVWDYMQAAFGFIFFEPQLIGSVISIVSVLSVLFYYSWTAGLVTATVFPFLLMLCIFFSRKTREKENKLSESGGELKGIALASINGAFYIKRMAAADYLLGKQREEMRTYKKHYTGAMVYQNLYSTLMEFLISLFPLTLFAVAVASAALGTGDVSNAMLIFSLASTLILPLQLAQNAIGLKISSNKRYKRIALLNDFIDTKHGGNMQKIDTVEKLSIKIKSFRYSQLDGAEKKEDEKILLKDFSLDLSRGEIAVITGESGSGKSTLLKFLAYETPLPAECGTVEVNSINLSDIDENTYYRCMQYVPQGNYLFKDTLRGNLCFGQNFSDEEIAAAIKTAALEDFVAEYTLDHEISEGSKNISGGQLSRICIARALLRKPSLVILDEPTAALDEATAKKLIDNLREYSRVRNSAMLIVTHNKDIAEIADKEVSL